jgi:hypothetical protein
MIRAAHALTLACVGGVLLAGCGGSSGTSDSERAAAIRALSSFRTSLSSGNAEAACEGLAASIIPDVVKQNYGSGPNSNCPSAIAAAIKAPGAWLQQVADATLVRSTVTSSGIDVYFSATFLSRANSPRTWYAEMVNPAGVWQIADICTPHSTAVMVARKQGNCILNSR